MHVKDILDYFGIRVKLPQHWYSTDVSNEFEDAELLQNDEIIKKEVSFEAKILEIHEKSILVEPVEGSNELKSSDKISLGVSNINIDFDLQLGQTILCSFI